MRRAGDLGIKGTELKFFNDFVKGRTEPFNEKDLSKDDLQGLKKLITQQREHQKSMGEEVDSRKKDAIDYSSYDFVANKDIQHLRNLLGQFNYEIKDNGDLVITDTYNFDKWYHESDASQFDQLKQMFTDPLRLAKGIAHKLDRKPIPVEINLGKIK